MACCILPKNNRNWTTWGIRHKNRNSLIMGILMKQLFGIAPVYCGWWCWLNLGPNDWQSIILPLDQPLPLFPKNKRKTEVSMAKLTIWQENKLDTRWKQCMDRSECISGHLKLVDFWGASNSPPPKRKKKATDKFPGKIHSDMNLTLGEKTTYRLLRIQFRPSKFGYFSSKI